MGNRHTHTTSSRGVHKKVSDIPPSWRLVSMAEYVSDLGYYDSQHDEESESFWASSKAKHDVESVLGDMKKKKH